MSIIAWIVLGAIAGYLAGFLVKGDEGLGVIGHIVLGIVGALVGGFLAGVLLFNSNADRRPARHQLDRRRDDRRDHRGRRREHGHRPQPDGSRRDLTTALGGACAPPQAQSNAHRPRWAFRFSPATTTKEIPDVEDPRSRRRPGPGPDRVRPVDPVRDVPEVHGGREVRPPARRHDPRVGRRRRRQGEDAGRRRSPSRSPTSGSPGPRPRAPTTPAS